MADLNPLNTRDIDHFRTRKCGNAQRDGRPGVGQCRHLGNATDLLTPVLWTITSGWVRTLGLFLAVCGSKYTKLSLPVWECPQFATPFSDWRRLVAFRRYSRSSCEVVRNHAKFEVFGPPNFGEKGHPSFWPNFINLGHHWTCGNVWWWSAKRHQRFGCEKRRIKKI